MLVAVDARQVSVKTNSFFKIESIPHFPDSVESGFWTALHFFVMTKVSVNAQHSLRKNINESRLVTYI